MEYNIESNVESDMERIIYSHMENCIKTMFAIPIVFPVSNVENYTESDIEQRELRVQVTG